MMAAAEEVFSDPKATFVITRCGLARTDTHVWLGLPDRRDDPSWSYYEQFVALSIVRPTEASTHHLGNRRAYTGRRCVKVSRFTDP
jgi:hypothetical protein